MVRTDFLALLHTRRPTGPARWARPVLFLGALLAVVPPLLCAQMATQQAAALAMLQSQRAQLADDAAEAARLEADLARWDTSRRVARQAHAADAQWHALLTELRDRTPDGLWFESVRIGLPAETRRTPTSDERRHVVLRGRAENHQAIGLLLENLTRSPWFAAVSLTKSGQDAADDGQGTPFEVDAMLRRAVRVTETEARQ